MNDELGMYAIEPQLIERKCGGWLAITPRGCRLSIGVTGGTLAEARQRFEAALDRWSKIEETGAHE